MSKRQDEPAAAGGRDAGHPLVGVLTVDDQAVFRRVARDVIEATAGFEQVGEASCGEEALEMVEEVHPELVLLDVRMPGMDGIETARRISEADPTTTIVLMRVKRPTHESSRDASQTYLSVTSTPSPGTGNR